MSYDVTVSFMDEHNEAHVAHVHGVSDGNRATIQSRYAPGSSVPITYRKDAPEQVTLEVWDKPYFPIYVVQVLLMALAFPAFALLPLAGIEACLGFYRLLLRYGISVEGHVEWVEGEGRVLHYLFRDSKGRERSGSTTRSSLFAVNIGDPVTILYFRSAPRINDICYDLPGVTLDRDRIPDSGVETRQ